MAAPICARLPFRALKRAKIPSLVTAHGVRHRSNLLELNVTSEGVDIVELAKQRGIDISEQPKYDEETRKQLESLREPQNLASIRLAPLRRQPQYGIPVCDLQLRTYHIRNLDLFADFALRAAYYLGLPAKGPIPLPRITERWVVPKSNFVHKKSQENFERITMRRLIQIQDGHPETVRIWLGVLMKYQYHGVGMKANIWEHDSLDAAQIAEESVKAAQKQLDKLWDQYGTRADRTSGRKIEEALRYPQHVGVLAEWEKEQGLERGKFQKDIKEREIREKKASRAAAWKGRKNSGNAAEADTTTTGSGSIESATAATAEATMKTAPAATETISPESASIKSDSVVTENATVDAAPAVAKTDPIEAAPTVTEISTQDVPAAAVATLVEAAPAATEAASVDPAPTEGAPSPVELQVKVKDSITKLMSETTANPDTATSIAEDGAPVIDPSPREEQLETSGRTTNTPNADDGDMQFPTAEEIEAIANSLQDGAALRSPEREDAKERREPSDFINASDNAEVDTIEPQTNSSLDGSKTEDAPIAQKEDVLEPKKKD